jgi:hypothetical protein
MNQALLPKIPWDQKLVDFCLGSLCEEFLFFFNSFFWTSELHISQAFQEHQARPILTSYEPVVKFCSKQVLSLFILYFLRSSCMQSWGWNYPRAEGQGAKKEVCFSIESWFFTFFTIFFCSWFYMMSPSIWPLQYDCEVFDFFQEILQGPYCWSFESQPPSTKWILAHS